MIKKLIDMLNITSYSYNVKSKILFIYQPITVNTLLTIREKCKTLRNIIVREHRGGNRNV